VIPCFDLPQETTQAKMRCAALFLLSLFLFVSPFPHTQTIGEICFYSTFLIFAYFSLRFGVRFERDDIWSVLLLFGGWGLVSSAFALNPSESFAYLYSHFMKYLLLTAMLVVFFASRQGVVILAWVMVISGTTLAVISTWYFYGVLDHAFLTRMDLPRWPANTMGFVLLFSLALLSPLFQHAAQKKTKYLLLGSALALTAAALLTQSRATFLSLGLMCFIFCYCNKKMLGFILLSAFTIATIATPISSRFAQGDPPRIALVLYTAEIIKDYPLTGIGFSLDTFKDPAHIDSVQYAARIPEQYRKVVNFLWPHNMILDVAVRTGLIGAILFCLFWGMLFLAAFRLLRQAQDRFVRDWALALLAALTMFAVKGMLEPITTHFVLTVFHGILAMLLILVKLQKEPVEAS